MVMNKKGFLKILEAIIAIILVFGFVIAVYPKAPLQSEVPEDLQLTMDAIVKQAQNDPRFRECVLGGSVEEKVKNVEGNEETKTLFGVECINEFIKKNSPPLFPWGHGIRLCTLDDNGISVDCNFGKGDSSSGVCTSNLGSVYNADNTVVCSSCHFFADFPVASSLRRKCFNEGKLPLDRNVFARTVSLSVQDVVSRPIPPVSESPPLDERSPSSKSLTLYFWFKG